MTTSRRQVVRLQLPLLLLGLLVHAGDVVLELHSLDTPLPAAANGIAGSPLTSRSRTSAKG